MYCIVDIETTGSFAAGSGITEIAAYLHDGVQIQKKFTTLINPEKRIPLHITALTGISQLMVADAPTFDEIADTLFEFLQGQIFVAHNVNFDYSFIKYHLQKSGYDLNLKKLCTVRLARKTFPGLRSYSLGRLCSNLSIPIADRHRADGDAKATVLLFEKIIQANGQNHIDEMLKKSSGEQWLPMQLTKQKIMELPECAGVYYFKDEKKKVIYVGKAVNIRKRVVSHFTGNDSGSRRQHFLRQVQDVCFECCTNELHALILESTEIKRLWPKYNRSQKEPLVQYALYEYTDRAGYRRLVIDKKRKHAACVCFFNTITEAAGLLRQLCSEYLLNTSLCFMGTAAQAPTEVIDEHYSTYNPRVEAALSSLADRLPSYAIVEPEKGEELALCLLVERGNFFGMGYIPVQQKNYTLQGLKEILVPYRDNNFIRNSLLNYAHENPGKRIDFSNPGIVFSTV